MENYKKFWVNWLLFAIIGISILLVFIIIPLWSIAGNIDNCNCAERKVRVPRILFAIRKEGIHIVLKRKYHKKIQRNHPKVEVGDIKNTIRNGIKLKNRRQGKEHWIFYNKIGNKILKVPVMLQLSKGIIKTAHFVVEEDEGIIEKMLIKGERND